MAVDQYVFCLDIAMHDVQVMEVQQGLTDHQQKLLGLALRQAVLRLGQQVVVERVGPSVLEDKIELGRSLHHIDKLSDGLVRQLCQDVDLPLQILDLVWLVQSLLLVDLDGYLLIGPFVHTHSHDTVCALTQFPVDLVESHLLLTLHRHDEVQQAYP